MRLLTRFNIDFKMLDYEIRVLKYLLIFMFIEIFINKQNSITINYSFLFVKKIKSRKVISIIIIFFHKNSDYGKRVRQFHIHVH